MDNSATPGRKNKIAFILISLLLLVLIGSAFTWYFSCPCDRLPGGYLAGEQVDEPVSDWTFVNKEPLCQIEVGTWLRHSVNLNCMAVDGEMYLSCANCEGKHWSTMAIADPVGRIRVGHQVYPISLSRVTDPNILDIAWQARATKLGRPANQRADGWWSFRVRSRQ